VGVGAGLYMYSVVVEQFTFAISSPGEFLVNARRLHCLLIHKFRGLLIDCNASASKCHLVQM